MENSILFPFLVSLNLFQFPSKVYFNLSAPYAEFIDSYYSGVVIAFIRGDENSEGGYLQIAGSLSGGALFGNVAKHFVCKVIKQAEDFIRSGLGLFRKVDFAPAYGIRDRLGA